MNKITSSKYCSVLVILGCEFCERLAHYGLLSSLTLFLRRYFGYTTSQASLAIYFWAAFAMIFSVFGGYVSDAFWGRKKTILVGCIVYFFALLSVSIITDVVVLADDFNKVATDAFLWISLFTVSIGAGGIKANVGVFGVDQLNDLHTNDAQSLEFESSMETASGAEIIQSYWNWFYFVINAGALISYSLIAYLCQDVSFAIGWSIPAIAMFILLCLFIWRSSKFVIIETDGSMISKFFAVSAYAIKHRNRRQEIENEQNRNKANDEYDDDEDTSEWDYNIQSKSKWLNVSKIENGGEFENGLVDEMKSVYRLLWFFTFYVMYWAVYSQMSSLFYSQGCQMDYRMNTFNFPISALNDADTIIILILVPVCDRILYPFMAKTRWCFKFDMLRRIGVGFFFAVLAMVVAGLIEVWRKESGLTDVKSTCDSSIYISDLNIMWQLPQYLLIGVSEVFASITSLEFFAGQAPDSMRTILYSLNIFVAGVGSLFSAVLVLCANAWSPEWIPNNLNNGYLDYFFFLLAGMMLITLITFIPYARSYEYRPGTDASQVAMHRYESLQNKTNDDT